MDTTAYINKDLNYDHFITKEEYLSRRRNFVPHRFDGKVAIITGGTSGIGFSTAQELGREGCRITITGRNPQTGYNAAKQLEAEGIEVLYLSGDMSDESFCHKIADDTYSKFGRIDFLFNIAFMFLMKGLDAKTEDWSNAFFAGPVGYARMIQNVVPYMEKTGGGSIVNVASISGHIAQPNFWTYSMMKGAVLMLTKDASYDLARKNIRVNTLSPATIFTRVTSGNIVTGTPEGRRYHMKCEGHGYMLNRAGEPVECASVALFLFSDDSSYVTGSEYMVDGGFISLGAQGSIEKVHRDTREYGLEYVPKAYQGITLFDDMPDKEPKK